MTHNLFPLVPQLFYHVFRHIDGVSPGSSETARGSAANVAGVSPWAQTLQSRDRWGGGELRME